MKKNNKGFTLIEIISVVIIVGVILMIAVPSVSKYLSKAKLTTYDTYVSNMKSATINLMTECVSLNKDYCEIPASNGVVVYTLEELISNNYSEPLVDPEKDGAYCDAQESFVVVTNKSENDYDFEYQVCLKCSNYQSPDEECEYTIPEEERYQITLDSRDANDKGTASVYAYFGQELPEIEIPQKDNYIFEGYYTAKEGLGVKYYNADGTGSRVWDKQSTITLYAHYTPMEYTVLYNPNGGMGTTQSQTCIIDSPCIIKEQLFTFGGLEFLNWGNKAVATGSDYKTYNPGESYINLTDGQQTITLYANWDKSVIVSFDKNGGTSISASSKTVAYGSTYGSLPSGYLLGHTLAGWYTTSSGGSQITATTSVTNTYDHILYAKWTPKTCNISYNENGGVVSGNNTSIFAHTCTYGTACTLDSGSYFTKDKYKFAGWSTLSTAVTPTYSGGASTTNICGDNDSVTLYAVWEYLPAPTCEIELEGTEGNAGWYKSNVEATLTTTGTYTSRKLKIGSTTVSGTTGTVSNNGTTSVVGTACNGTNCNTCTADVMIDKENPTLTITNTSSSGNNHVFTIEYSDTGGSGLASTNSYQYYISTNATTPTGGSWTTYSNNAQVTVTASATAKYILVKKIYDVAGNASTTSTYHISSKIAASDTTAPTCTLKVDKTSYTAGSNWYNEDVTISFSSKSDNVAVTDYYIATSNTATSGTTTKTLTAEQVITTYYGIVKDAAGNKGTCSIEIGIDKTPPVVEVEVYRLCKSNQEALLLCDDYAKDIYSYTYAKSTYEAQHTVTDELSQLIAFGQRWQETAKSNTLANAEAYSNSLDSGSNAKYCTTTDGKVTCARTGNDTTLWNCRTESEAAASIGAELSERPKVGTSYYLLIAAIDTAGNYTLYSADSIQYILEPSLICTY